MNDDDKKEVSEVIVRAMDRSVTLDASGNALSIDEALEQLEACGPSGGGPKEKSQAEEQKAEVPS